MLCWKCCLQQVYCKVCQDGSCSSFWSVCVYATIPKVVNSCHGYTWSCLSAGDRDDGTTRVESIVNSCNDFFHAICKMALRMLATLLIHAMGIQHAGLLIQQWISPHCVMDLEHVIILEEMEQLEMPLSHVMDIKHVNRLVLQEETSTLQWTTVAIEIMNVWKDSPGWVIPSYPFGKGKMYLLAQGMIWMLLCQSLC